LKITHIGPDSIFLQFISGVFESEAPGANEYIVLTNSADGSLRFPIRKGRVRTVPSVKRGIASLVFGVRDSDMIVAHMMTQHAAISFLTAPRGTIKVWSGWGADYYGSDESPDSGLLGASTLALSKSLNTESDAPTRLLAVKDRIKDGTIRRLIHGAAGKADYFSAPLPDDFSVFKQRFPEFHGRYGQIYYANVRDSFARGGEGDIGPNILVGNSATLTNNHLEVFDQLAGLDISGRRIIVPLSYGNPDYRDAIVSKGSELFGSAFMPLVDYMQLEEYLSLVASCNVVIMNHKRQQALSNIGAALYRGANVFLNEASPVVNFFRSRGAIIYTTRELRSTGLPNAPLPLEAVATNRRVLEEWRGSERVVEKVRALVSYLNS